MRDATRDPRQRPRLTNPDTIRPRQATSVNVTARAPSDPRLVQANTSGIPMPWWTLLRSDARIVDFVEPALGR